MKIRKKINGRDKIDETNLSRGSDRLKIVNETEPLISEDTIIGDLIKVFAEENRNLEEALTKCISENDRESLKTEFPKNGYI